MIDFEEAEICFVFSIAPIITQRMGFVYGRCVFVCHVYA